MSDLILRERDKYDEVWASISAYGHHSPGASLVSVFESMRRDAGPVTILDAGCGSGKGALALTSAGHVVTCADTTAAGLVDEALGLPFVAVNLWDDLTSLGRFHYVYCCDVLEHIPPTFTMLVVARLLAIAERGLFLNIALQPDHFGAWIGSPLHLTLQSFTDWRDQLNAVGRLVEARDLLTNGAYLVEAR